MQGFNARNPVGNAQFEIRPDQHLTEAEFLTTLFRQSHQHRMDQLSSQATSGWWAETTYLVAEDLGLETSGNSLTRHGSGDPITRGDAARLLASMYMPMNVDQEFAVDFMYSNDLSNGYTGTKTYEDYRVDNILQRSHIASFLRRFEENVMN